MLNKFSFTIVIIAMFLLFGCQSKSNNKIINDNELSDAENHSIEYTYDFEENMDGWTGGFAGVSENYMMDGYDINFSHGDYLLMDSSNRGIYLTGNNLVSDMFMYTSKKFDSTDGLKPLTSYLVDVEFDVASNMATGVDNIPRDQIYIKAGVVNIQPRTELTEKDGNFFYINLDKGDKSSGGKDLTTLGNAAIAGLGEDVYGQKNFQQVFNVMTNSNGELWVVIGVDTAFKGTSALYVDNVTIKIDEND